MPMVYQTLVKETTFQGIFLWSHYIWCGYKYYLMRWAILSQRIHFHFI